MPIDELILACIQSVSNSIFEICLDKVQSAEGFQVLDQNIQEIAKTRCQDFFWRRLPHPGNLQEVIPSQWTPRTAENVSRVVFSEIMHINSLGDYKTRCEELLRPKAVEPSSYSIVDLNSKLNFSSYLSPSLESSSLNELWVNTLIVFSIGGLACYFFGPSKVMSAGLKLARFAGVKSAV